MSLGAFAPRIAQSLLTSAGALATFTRAGLEDYDPITNTTTRGAPLTWQAPAVWSSNVSRTVPTTGFVDGSPKRSTARTLLVSGLNVQAPRAGDRVTFGGTTYLVGHVTNVADVDGGAVPAYRCEVSA